MKVCSKYLGPGFNVVPDTLQSETFQAGTLSSSAASTQSGIGATIAVQVQAWGASRWVQALLGVRRCLPYANPLRFRGHPAV